MFKEAFQFPSKLPFPSKTGKSEVHLKKKKRLMKNGLFISFNHFHQYLLSCSVAQSCLTFCDPMDGSTPGFPVLYYLLEVAQTHVH